MKELVQFIVTSLVDHPDEVDVAEVETDDGLIIELSVAGSDMGRIIGKGGRVVNAIRTVVDVAAKQRGISVSLELLEDED